VPRGRHSQFENLPGAGETRQTRLGGDAADAPETVFGTLHGRHIRPFDRAFRERADRFATEARALKEQFVALPSREAGRTMFVDLALGQDSHVKRHLVHLAAAQHRIWSYMEQGDIEAIDGTKTPVASAPAHCPQRRDPRRRSSGCVRLQLSRRAQACRILKKHRANLDHVTESAIPESSVIHSTSLTKS